MKQGARVTVVDVDGNEFEASVLAVKGDHPGPRELDLKYENRTRPGSAPADVITLEDVKHQSVVSDAEPLPHWRMIDEPKRTFVEQDGAPVETLRKGQTPEAQAEAAGRRDEDELSQ